MLIKGSLTLSKPCTAGSVALRERDGCQRVSGEKSSHRIQLAAEMGWWLGATAHTGLCSLPPRPGLLAGSTGRGLSSERVSEPPSSLEGKFIIETKAMLGPSGAFPVPFPPEVPQERAHTPQLGHTVGKHGEGGICVLGITPLNGAHRVQPCHGERGRLQRHPAMAERRWRWDPAFSLGTETPPRQGKPMVVLRVGSAPSIPDVTCVLSWCPAAPRVAPVLVGCWWLPELPVGLGTHGGSPGATGTWVRVSPCSYLGQRLNHSARSW